MKFDRSSMRTGYTQTLAMKRKKTSSSHSSSYLTLTDDCLEIIMRLSEIDLSSLSLVSKQFLSITHRLRTSIIVKDATRPYLPRLFKRFTNLTSLDLSPYKYPLDELLIKISTFPLKQLTSLKLPLESDFPANGLQAFSKTITSLTSFTCSHAYFDNDHLLLLIADCFPLLKQLNLSHPGSESAYFDNIHINGIQSLLSNSPYIQHLDLSFTCLLNDQHVADFSLLLPHLVSINLTRCWKLTESALFSLVTNCPSLTDIKMVHTTIGKDDISNSNSFASVKSPKLKSLSLAGCQYLRDENILLYASLFPNLEVLDLSYCNDVTEKGANHVVQNCTQLKEINMRSCDQVQNHVVSSMVLSRPSLKKIVAPFVLSDRKRKVFMLRHGCHVS